MVGIAPLPANTPLPMDETLLNRLAHECARDLYPLSDILTSFKIDATYFEENVRNHPRFMLFYAEAHTLWNSGANFKERSAIKAGIVFEQWLGECDKLMHNPAEPLTAKAKIAELLARVSGIDKDKSAGVTAGERVVVNINLGAGNQITIDKQAPVTLEGHAVTVPEAQ